MGLSVENARFESFQRLANKRTQTKKETEEIPKGTDSTTGINLNKSSNSIYFKGILGLGRRNKGMDVEPFQKQGIGPYLLSEGQIYKNNRQANAFAFYLVNSANEDALRKNDGRPFEFFKQQADDETIEEMTDYAEVLLSHYIEGEINFPRFYDLVARALPLAMNRNDKQLGSYNGERIYENLEKRLVERGKKYDPETPDHKKTGIVYMYFSPNVRRLAHIKEDYNTMQMFNRFKSGKKPELVTCEISSNREEMCPCYMSTCIKDDFAAFTTPALRENSDIINPFKENITNYKNPAFLIHLDGYEIRKDRTYNPNYFAERYTPPAPKVSIFNDNWGYSDQELHEMDILLDRLT